MNKQTQIILFIIRMFSSIGFGILYASLALFLIKNLHIDQSKALAIIGVFISLHYSLALIAGAIVGRWISYIDALIIGILLQALSIPLIYVNESSFFIGCAIFLAGDISSSTPINMIITERFNINDQGRERVFMWNYAAMNLGNILGFSIAGYFQLINNFKNISYSSSGLMILSFILCLLYRHKLGDIHSKYIQKNLKGRILGVSKFIIALLILILIIKQILIYSSYTSTGLLFIIGGLLLVLLIYNFKQNYKNGIIFFALAICYLLFWALYFLIPTGLTLFANYNTTNELFGFIVPTAWLPNINSTIVIFGAPVLAILFKKMDKRVVDTTLHKFIIGLLYLALSMLFVISGILIAKFNTVNLIWLVLTYIFLSFSELFIAPVGFAIVGKYVYRNNQSLMTGAWISILGLGGLIASKLSSFIKITQTNILISNKQYLILFVILFVITLAAICFFYIFKSLYFDKVEGKY